MQVSAMCQTFYMISNHYNFSTSECHYLSLEMEILALTGSVIIQGLPRYEGFSGDSHPPSPWPSALRCILYCPWRMAEVASGPVG